MAGNGGPGGGPDGPNSAAAGGQPLGTEYTLQGVMRFLQTEWHRHERDRNAWEIERAEMKARIAKMEGENRSGKKMQDSLSKHIHMLEQALKREREKSQAAASGEDAVPAKSSGGADEAKNGAKGKAGESKPPTKAHNSFLEVMPDAPSAYRQESQRQKSRTYLEKCLQEITYLLTPPAHPPPPQQQHMAGQDMAMGQGYPGPQSNQPTVEEVYMHQQQQHQQQQHQQQQHQQQQHQQQQHQQRQKNQQQSMALSHQSSLSNHQPPPVPSISDMPSLSHSMRQSQQASHMTRNLADQQPLPQGTPLSLMDDLAREQSAPEDPVQRVTHSFDSFGRPVPGRQDEADVAAHGMSDNAGNADTDGWNFDDGAAPEHEAAPQRPDTDLFPNANHVLSKSPPRSGPGSHRRKVSMSRRRSDGSASHEQRETSSPGSQMHMHADSASFKVRFALRGHLDVVRAVIFTGGGSPSEPEICTTGDDGVIKRWIIPASYSSFGPHGGASGNDLDITSYFTHRGHTGAVTSLAACPSSQNFSTGGRATGDGWIFSGGQDATVRVWERGRVDPKATLDGHTDAVWSVCVLPGNCMAVFGGDSSNYGGPDRILLASGAADGTVRIWAVSAPPQLTSPHSGSRRGVGGSRRHSVTSGSGFPSSPQPSTATTTPFHHTLVHTIHRPDIQASPTCIDPVSLTGDTFVVSYTDAAVLIFDTRTGEEVVGMASLETYDGTPATGVNSVVATTVGLEGSRPDPSRGVAEEEGMVHGATGSAGVDGVVISGHEDRYIRFFDANSGQCTYTMLAHPSAISSLSLSPDGRELVSAGHDASLRFWSLEKRSCTQEMTSHRLMRGEGVCAVVWSQDGRWVVSGGGDGVIKVFAR
ncbi:MAG: hypothetical protein M1832_001307 [Thelocarpon impressellum]|nr:MAG: hypothetical protein M1832_001307 [Thelocarpon impressellum]